MVGITLTKEDKDIGKYSCEATLSAKFPDINLEPKEKDKSGNFISTSAILRNVVNQTGLKVNQNTDTGAWHITGGVIESSIQYTSQLTADTKQQQVELTGAENITSFLLAISEGADYLK